MKWSRGASGAARPAIVTETLERVLAAIPAARANDRALAVIREQAERISRG
jgi:hypothetical protein